MKKRAAVPAPRVGLIPPHLYPELDDMVQTINDRRAQGELPGRQEFNWQVIGGWLSARIDRDEPLTPGRVRFRPIIQKELFPVVTW